MADKSIVNGIVNYSSRDYESLLNDFKKAIPTLTELWDGESDSDPGMVLGKYLAATADMLSTNLDIQANEVYAGSVSQRKNAEKLFALMGYTLGWWKAGRTEVTFTNTTDEPIKLDFGFNGANFCTLNAYTDITNTERVITYNILPKTSSYTEARSRSSRYITTSEINVFDETDTVTLDAGESCTRVAIEGELRSFNVSVADVKANNYTITLPSQHVDTTAVWVKAKANLSDDNFLVTQWRQVETVADFVNPEPLFAVTYDNYSNAQVTVSNYLNQLENYSNNYLVVYWMDCSGVIGSVGEDVLTNLIWAKTGPDVNAVTYESGDIAVSNLANTIELPHTYTVTGASPETAHEAYLNSRNYINTWDSLITLSDYNKFINREPGVDTGIIIDCQKALEYNLSVYNDPTLSDTQKSKKYITNADFPAGTDDFDWAKVLNLPFDPSDPQKFVFATNFQRYTAMTFCIHNDFLNSSFGQGQISTAYVKNTPNFIRYKAPQQFLDYINEDYAPLGAMTVDLQFGFTRLFNFTVIGKIYTTQPVSKDVADGLVQAAKDALTLFYAPVNRKYGQLPTVLEVVDIVKNADPLIAYFDAGNTLTKVIEWMRCDPECFNLISFARYIPEVSGSETLIVSPDCILD